MFRSVKESCTGETDSQEEEEARSSDYILVVHWLDSLNEINYFVFDFLK